jgi:hypothetical protein
MVLIVLQPSISGVGAPSSNFQVVQTYFGSLANPVEAAPGDKSVTFNVVVQNIGLDTYSVLDATLYLTFPFTNITGGNMARAYYSGGVLVGQTATLQFQLNIDDGALIGSYSAAMSLRYGTGLTLGETLYAPILLLGRAELNLSADPSSLPPGSTNTLTVDVSNEGTGSASKVSVTLTYPSGLSVSGDNQWSFQSIKPDEHEAIMLDIYAQPSLAGSSLQIGASMTYTDAYGTSRSLSRVVGIRILPLTNVPLVLTVKDNHLEPGTLNTISLDITNNQTKPISSVQASLALPAATGGTPPLVISGDNSWYFSSIGPLKSVTLNATLMVSSEAADSNYQLTLTLSYLDPFSVARTENHAFGVQVTPISNVPLVLTVKGGRFQPGTPNTISLNVMNNQTRPVSSVQASLTLPGATGGSPPLVILGDNSWFFRSIDPLKSVTFNATLMVSSSAANANYQLTLTLSYLDPYSVARTENHVFGVQVMSESENVLTVSVDNSVLTAGSFNEPLITIHNSGQESLRAITVSLSISTFAAQTSQNIMLATANQFNFDLLPPSGNITFPAKMFATLDAKDTSNQIQLSINYIDEIGVNHVKTVALGFVVKGLIILEVFNGQVIPRATLAGGNITITGDILNTGNTRAMYTTVSTKSSPLIQPLEGATYIGEIDTNIQTPFSLSVRIRKTANNGTYPITIVFDYEDDYSTAYAVEKTFNVTIGGFIPVTTPVTNRQNTPQGILQLPYLIIIGAVVVVSCVVLIYVRRRRHRK